MLSYIISYNRLNFELQFRTLDMDYVAEYGSAAHFVYKSEIDKKISEYAKDWDIDRIARVELTILRIAVFETFSAKASTRAPPRSVLLNTTPVSTGAGPTTIVATLPV